MTVEWRLRPGRNVLDFDGEDDHVDVGDPAALDFGTDDFTVAAWMNADTWVNTGGIVGKGASRDDEPGYALRKAGGSAIQAIIGDGSSRRWVNVSPQPTDEWIHTAMTVDRGGSMTLYVNGDPVDSEDLSDFSGSLDTDTPFTIGKQAVSFDGQIDDVRVYDTVLSLDDIERLWNFEDVTEDLVGHWPLDGGRGATARDVVGINDGTIQGADWAGANYRPDPDLLDVEVTDAFNRFARQATAVLDDPDGDKSDRYERPTPVDLDVRWGEEGDYVRRFGGFVVNPTSAQNRTTLEILSHDFWLRKRQVFRSFDDVPIEDVLAELIVDLTPLDWHEDNVTVVQNESITREWKGERLDEVLSELAAISADEEFGANDAGEFFFRPRETAPAPRNFTAGEYVAADFSEDAKQAVNEVTLYYGEDDDTGAVAVQDRASQLELADKLNRPRPVVIGETKSFPEIDSEEAAERKARQILEDRTVLQTGSLSTWDAFDVEPGDVTRVAVPEQGVDRDFRIAEITYRWRADETELRLAENTGGVVDTLVALSNEISRLDSRAADEDATITQFLEFGQQFGVDLQLEAYTRTVPDDQLLFGSNKGGWGDPRAGGGLWGDQRGQREQLIQQ